MQKIQQFVALLAIVVFALFSSVHSSSCPPLVVSSEIPANLQPLFAASPESVGLNSSQLLVAETLLHSAIATHLTPGAAYSLVRHGQIVLSRGFGTLDYASPIPVDGDTLYDLASLSKVTGTTTAVMMLYQAGKFSLETPIATFLPLWVGNAEKLSVTIKNLLTHTSGLQPDVFYYQQGIYGRVKYLAGICALPLLYPPGTHFIYSDLNFILLQAIVETLTGQTQDVFLQENAWTPLQMGRAFYNPLLPFGDRLPEDVDCRVGFLQNPNSPLLNYTVWTEMDSVYRHLHCHGIVQDENACAIGGVSGHAGLFVSATNLALFVRFLMANGSHPSCSGAPEQLIEAAIVELFTTRAQKEWSRALGWDTPAANCTCGEYMTNNAFGHLGFTGTMIWADKTLELGIILLTNRVDPTRNNGTEPRIQALRTAFSSAVTLAITDMEVSVQPRSPQ